MGTAVHAAEVLPTATVCDLLLRSARRAPRAISAEGTAKLREIVRLVTTDQVFRRRTLTDVRFAAPTGDGLTTLNDPAADATGTVVAREFIGEDEIASPLAAFDRDRVEIADVVSADLARRFPRGRPTELARLGLEVAGASLPSLIGLVHVGDLTNVPLAFATVFHNERRLKRQREHLHGVPGLDCQLRILRRSLLETPSTRAEGLHRALSIVRGTVGVTPELYRALIDGQPPGPRDLARLVDSGASLRANAFDGVRSEPPSFEITVESAVFTEPSPRECRLRWMILFRARRIEPPPDGRVRVKPVGVRPLARAAAR